MDDATPIIAALALLVSLGLLIVHYRNQLERRHGEIIQLRTQIITALSSIQQRDNSLLMNGELLRIELRRMRDCDDKWKSIEALPPILEQAKKGRARVAELLKIYEEMDTRDLNNSATLLRLQCEAAKLPKIVAAAEFSENRMLSLLTTVRKQGEA